MAGMQPLPPEPESGGPNQEDKLVFGLPKSQLILGAMCAALCFIYAYAIEIQEMICAFGESDRDVPELGLIIVGMGRVGKKLLEEMVCNWHKSYQEFHMTALLTRTFVAVARDDYDK